MSGFIIINVIDFIESASPMLVVLLLWNKLLFKQHKIFQFIFGRKPQLIPYIIVAILFVFQFFTFYIFRTPDSKPIILETFLLAWGGQILLGGGMEEGGWRGYLQPAFEKKVGVIFSIILVGVVWAVWHLPYFFLPGTFQSGNDFLFYTITTTATAFTLTAIYKLTGSILLCTLFHGWQNAIVMNIQSNMMNSGFLIMFLIQTVISILLCLKPIGTNK